MYAEFSTPFLMLWRYYTYDIFGLLFMISFFACRIVYHCMIFIPECITNCHPSVGYGFSIPYVLLNLYFFYMTLKKALMKKPKVDKKV